MIYIKKINITFLMFNVTMLCQAIEYYEAPQQETHTMQPNEIQSKLSPTNPPESIKAESQQEKNITNSTNKASTQNVENKSNITKNSISSSKPAEKNDINFNDASKAPIKTQLNPSIFDFAIQEEKEIESEIYVSPINSTDLAESTTPEETEDAYGLTEGIINTLASIISSSLQNVLFEILALPTDAQGQTAIQSLKNEIQYLSEQVKKYNDVNIYTDIDEMLEFIQSMNNFIKESQLVALSTTNIENIDTAYSTAVSTSDIFKKQNIILNPQLVPNEVVQIFTEPINNSFDLINIKDTPSMIHAVYDKNGSINLILNSWGSFMASKYNSIKNDLSYGAFMTFLLIFQDTIIVTTNILNRTSGEFQVTNPLPMKTINYSTPK